MHGEFRKPVLALSIRVQVKHEKLHNNSLSWMCLFALQKKEIFQIMCHTRLAFQTAMKVKLSVIKAITRI